MMRAGSGTRAADQQLCRVVSCGHGIDQWYLVKQVVIIFRLSNKLRLNVVGASTQTKMRKPMERHH